MYLLPKPRFALLLYDLLLHDPDLVPDLDATWQSEHMNSAAHATKNGNTNVFFDKALSALLFVDVRDVHNLKRHAHFNRHHASMESDEWLRLQLPVNFESAENAEERRMLAHHYKTFALVVKLDVRRRPIHLTVKTV